MTRGHAPQVSASLNAKLQREFQYHLDRALAQLVRQPLWNYKPDFAPPTGLVLVQSDMLPNYH